MSLRGLAGKIAIVTGGAGEIGVAVVSRLVIEGAAVVVVDRDGQAANRVAASFQSPSIIAVCADVATPEGNDAWVSAAIGRFGRIDLVHNNAGIEGQVAQIVDVAIENLDRVLAVNVRGTFLTLQATLRLMRRQEAGGAIVNTSSFAGLRGIRKLAPYVMSKHAIVGLTRCAALESAAFGVRVNAIAPGPIRTRMMRSIEQGTAPDDPMLVRRRNIETIPMGRYGEPDEIAAAVAWLLSDEASYLNGATITIDGARTA